MEEVFHILVIADVGAVESLDDLAVDAPGDDAMLLP
jgi:hypothetical protein